MIESWTIQGIFAFFFKLECGELEWSAEREYGVIHFGKKSVILFDTREYAQILFLGGARGNFPKGAIFRGAIFLGGLFPGGTFPGDIFPGGHFSGAHFSRGHFS